MQLRPFQKAGAEFLAKAKRGWLCDPVGAGKSTQALHAVEAAKATPCVIVCPASMRLTWAREVAGWFPGRSVHAVLDSSPIPRVEYVIVNYDRLAARLAELLRLMPKSIVLDEIHLCKNGKAKRSKAAKMLAWKCEYRFALTATPMLNHPEELVHPLTMLGRFHEVSTDWLTYVTTYCGARVINYGGREVWDFKGATNMASLNEKLFRRSGANGMPIMLRRSKEEVLPELPKHQDIIVPCTLSNRAEYDLATNDFRKWLIDQKLLSPESTDEQYAEAIIDLGISGEPNAGVKAAKLRQLVGVGKVKATVEWVREFLEDTDEKLVIFAYHRAVQEGISKGLADVSVSIEGGDTMEQRQRAIDAFQRNPETRVIVCSIRAAGVGITLTAASKCLFAEVTYGPADRVQASGRVNRIGQTADNTISYYLTAAGTVEGKMWAAMEKKEQAIVGAIGEL